jgi:O-antigen/teichoic acid export membrane protein
MNVRSLVFACCPSPLRPLLDRIERSPTGYRMARGIFWSTCGAVVSRALLLLASFFMARMLGRDGFGELGMIRSTVDMFAIFAGFGLGLTATKHVAGYCRSDPGHAGRIMAVSGLFAFVTGGVIAVVLFVFAPWLAEHSLDAPHMANPLRISVIILFITAINGAQTGSLAGFEAFRAIAKINLLVGIASFPLLVGGVYIGGLSGAVWALAIIMGINWLLSHLALREESARFHVPLAFKGCLQEWPVLWKFSLPAAISGIMVGPVLWICNAILVNEPGGYGQMGILNAANQWQMAILFLPSIAGRIALPMLSSLTGQDDRAKYIAVLKANVLIAAGTTLTVAAAVAIAAPWIMRAYGPGFEQGPWVLACLAFSAVLVAVNNVVGQVIISKGHMWIGFGFNALWAATMLAGSFVLIRAGHGALGLALATLIAYLLHTLWQGLFMIRTLRTHGIAEKEI